MQPIAERKKQSRSLTYISPSSSGITSIRFLQSPFALAFFPKSKSKKYAATYNSIPFSKQKRANWFELRSRVFPFRISSLLGGEGLFIEFRE
jgi:hypothetical protein